MSLLSESGEERKSKPSDGSERDPQETSNLSSADACKLAEPMLCSTSAETTPTNPGESSELRDVQDSQPELELCSN